MIVMMEAMTEPVIRRTESTDELFAAAGRDYLLRSDAAPEESLADQGVAWLAADGGFAFGGSKQGADLVDWLTVIGTPDTALALLRRALAELPRPPHGFSVPRETDLGSLAAGELDQWDFMAFDPAWGVDLAVLPGEERVAELLPSAAADAEIREFLKLANPSHSAKPGWEGIQAWGVVRDAGGALLACGAYCRRDGGNGYLASIGTAPAARGQGLGAAVSSWLTRRSVANGDDFCALGHWHPNEPARRIYARLGYRTTHQMKSGRLAA
ncbi:ribosomal protein S18 acetylase RimI-like enzyme [Catenulispora sp. GP43]